jgi:hypothetical protein
MTPQLATPVSTSVSNTGDTLKVFLLPANSEGLYLQILALIATILAVIVGPLISLYISQKQIRATVRSTNRQQWIHILRDQLSEFASQLMGLILNLDRDTSAPKDEKVFSEKTERLIFLQTKIDLLLNPEKPDQKEIIDLVDNARMAAIGRELARLEAFHEEIVSKSQALFKLTWERIKKLE